MAPRPKNSEENGTTTKDKLSANTGAGISKSKKSTGGSSLKDVTNASSSAAENGNGGANGQIAQNNATLDFENLPRHVLHAYRAAYNLHQPSSFKSLHNGLVLSAPGSVGLQSPTMLRAKEKRRIPKQQLAKVVRGHFCDQSVSELDVEARLMYNVKQMDKPFRMKFPPNGPVKKAS